MKNKYYHTVRTVPNSSRKFVDRNKIDSRNTQIYDRSLSWLDTGTSIKSGGVKLVLFDQTEEKNITIKQLNLSSTY